MKTLTTTKTIKIFLGTFVLATVFAACGGGGAESYNPAPEPNSPYMLSWDAPDTTIDNTVIDPYEDLNHYELYVSETGDFSEEDAPVAFVSAIEDFQDADGVASKKLVTEFDLALLKGLPNAQQLYVSLRAVGADGQKSDFMNPVTWTRS